MEENVIPFTGNGEGTITVKARYSQLEAERHHFHEMGVKMARLTIPTLLPPLDAGQDHQFNTPYQGLGSRGVNTLASKLLLTLFPPTASFFRLEIPDVEIEKLGLKIKAEIEESFAKIEKAVNFHIETQGMRIKLYEAIKHLLVVGNVMIYAMPNGKLKVFKLSNYVVKRDGEGEVMLIIIKEKFEYRTLAPDVRAEIAKPSVDGDQLRQVEMYTEIELQEDGKWRVRQEVEGRILNVPSSHVGYYKKDELPYIVLTFIRPSDSDYGRGYVEEQAGDLWSLEGLMKAVLEGSAAAARLIFLVRPGSTVDKKKLQAAENLEVLSGADGDVTVVQTNKQADLSITYQMIGTLSQRLSQAFLLNSSVQRDAERVSAEEIRVMAQELEASLGGIRSILSQELQLPLLGIILKSLTASRSIPKLPNKVKPLITTGVETLGRGQDVSALAQYIEIIQKVGGLERALQFISEAELHRRLLVGLGISPLNLIKSQEQMDADKQAAEEDAEKAAVNEAAVRAAPNIAQAAMNPQQPQQQPQ